MLASLRGLEKFVISVASEVLQTLYAKAARWRKPTIDGGLHDVWDLVDVADGNKFMIEGGIIVHNCLGISYDMTAPGIANKIKNDTGEDCTVEQAQAYIDLFYSTYYDYAAWKQDLLEKYKREKHLMLPCGWMMFGDNPNFRSIGNCPIQGVSASIMRLAVAIAQDEGLDIIMTLHDALYPEVNLGDWNSVDTLVSAMDQAFKYYLGSKSAIRQDVYAWGRGVEALAERDDKGEAFVVTPKGTRVAVMDEYVDDRAVNEAKQYAVYWKSGEVVF